MATNALLIYNDDFIRRNFWNWVVSHISGSLPPHRYKGTIELQQDRIVFDGYDIVLKKDTQLIIKKAAIQQVYHGYDLIYNIWQTRGLGLNWAPVRLQLYNAVSDSNEFLYIIAGYNYPGALNRDLYSYLTEWLS
jgi:hypothetical protein